jgi:hypothetical protein
MHFKKNGGLGFQEIVNNPEIKDGLTGSQRFLFCEIIPQLSHFIFKFSDHSEFLYFLFF